MSLEVAHDCCGHMDVKADPVFHLICDTEAILSWGKAPDVNRLRFSKTYLERLCQGSWSSPKENASQEGLQGAAYRTPVCGLL